MLLENWLYMGSLNIKTPYCPPLKGNIKSDCLVIGGGVAGLHAALRLANAGKKVILLEKRICGGSASGRSGGFLTPESEEDIKLLIKELGEKKAKIVYDIPLKGVDLMVNTIKKNKFDCDLRKQDSLYLSIKKSHNSTIEEEAKVRKELGLPYKLYDEKNLKKIHPGKGYTMGMKYPGSYGINSFAYTQEMKNLLIKKGVKIHEDTEVHSIIGNTAKTHLGSVKADNIIVCMDKMKKEFNEDISKKCYHFQIYMTVSEPLNDKEMKSIFPDGELMCWDTRWDFMYYRPIEENRILLGGTTLLTNYYPKHYYSPGPTNSFVKEMKYRFPEILDVDFTHYWMGLMDVTKDLMPILDTDKSNKSIQYVLGCAGLPWAAFCGDYAASKVIGDSKLDLSNLFSMDRKFFVPEGIQKYLGKAISFGLSHLRQILK